MAMTNCPAAERVFPAVGPGPKVHCQLAAQVDPDSLVLFDPVKDCTPYTNCSVWQAHKNNWWNRIQHERKL